MFCLEALTLRSDREYVSYISVKFTVLIQREIPLHCNLHGLSFILVLFGEM